MHSSTVDCDNYSNKEKVTIYVLVINVEETGSQAMLSLGFSSLMVNCLMKRLE